MSSTSGSSDLLVKNCLRFHDSEVHTAKQQSSDVDLLSFNLSSRFPILRQRYKTPTTSVTQGHQTKEMPFSVYMEPFRLSIVSKLIFGGRNIMHFLGSFNIQEWRCHAFIDLR